MTPEEFREWAGEASGKVHQEKILDVLRSAAEQAERGCVSGLAMVVTCQEHHGCVPIVMGNMEIGEMIAMREALQQIQQAVEQAIVKATVEQAEALHKRTQEVVKDSVHQARN